MRSSLHEIASVQYGTHHTMSDHERSRRSSLLGERQELVRYLAHSVAIERNEARCPETEQYREQKQWILRRLSEGFSLFDQQTCSLCSGLSFRSTISFDVHKRGYGRNLKLDMLTAQRGRGRQSGDLIEGARELLYCFDQRRLRQRPLPRFAPKVCGFLDQAGLGPMSRQQLRSALSAFRELALDGFGDAGMQCAS